MTASVDPSLRPMLRRGLITGVAATAATWPLGVRAQQKVIPVIGLLNGGTSPGTFVLPFRQGLAETGYVEGQNVAIEYRWAEGDYNRLSVLAADLVGRKIDVIVTQFGAPAALA